jgi:hypothetical protein
MPDRPPHDRATACYRPAVFFRQLGLNALAFPYRKIRRPFKKVTISILYTL